ncbi:energy-coupling factor transporter transmembrane protein EcfT [Candidatus Micrarchaeota archaeon]|nr:energy-coupling factor transporter transmembrane protein EcfT [Candidatus Micrarchaeota archaeon]
MADSPLHKLSAVYALPAFVLLTISLVLFPLEYALAFLALLIPLYWISHLSLFQTLSHHRFLLVFAIVAFLFRLILTGQWPESVLSALYLTDLFLLSLLFWFTTTPAQLRDALHFYRVPRSLTFMFLLAFSALPLLQQQLQRVRIAQASRGNTRAVFPLLLPLLHSVFDRSRKLAISLESRGFQPE